MKRIARLAFVLALLIGILSGCTYCRQDTIGNFTVMYGTGLPFLSGRSADGAAVTRFVWDGDPAHTQIVLPDTYGSEPITHLGGYYGRGLPQPFVIDADSYLHLVNDTRQPGNDGSPLAISWETIEEYADRWSLFVCTDFDLHIGKNVNSVYADAYVTEYTVGGVKTAYAARVFITCDEENPTFYAKDGKLYTRADDALVPGFLYTDQLPQLLCDTKFTGEDS